MPVRSQPWDLGPGLVLSLANIEDLDQLSQRDLVPTHMRELFANAPSALVALADRADIAGYAQWLRSAATSTISIEIYDLPPGAGMPSAALLTFDFGTYTTPHGSFPWRLAATCTVGAPSQCPAGLAEVWNTLGGIYEQYGGSGYLLDPESARPLASMGDEVEHLLAEDGDPVMSRQEARAWTPYFAADGDYLCYGTDGSSRWVGSERGASDEPRETAAYIDALFRCWLNKQHFRGAE